MRKPTKLQQLREQLGSGGQTLDEIERIARSIGAWEDRFAARPAAEMLIAQGAPGADVMERTLRDMPFTGTDQRAELLRAACGEALRRDGIPAGVEQRARDFYERGRGRGHRHGAQPAAPAVSAATTRYEPVQPSGSPDVVNAIVNALRRLFGRS